MVTIVKGKWGRTVFSAELLKVRPDGMYLMRARSNGNRFHSGAEIIVDPKDLLEPVPADEVAAASV